MSEVIKRSLTGAGIVALIVTSIYVGPKAFLPLVCVIALIGQFEFYRLFELTGRSGQTLPGMTLSLLLLIGSALFQLDLVPLEFFLIPVLLCSLIFFLTLISRLENAIPALSTTILGIVYVTTPFILLIFYAFNGKGIFEADILLGYFLLLWANDTGAYIVGSSFGKTRLAPLISPKKTWEGSIGGAAIAFIVGAVNSYVLPGLTLRNWIIIALMVIVFGTMGDLVKSVIKRSKNVKDTGTILPGHGGILDRFDSLIGSIPFVYTYVSLIAR